MKLKRSSIYIIAGLVFSTFLPAYAAVIKVDFNSPGDNLITRDTSLGLDFLSFSATSGMTREEIQAELSPGGAFEGFGVASSESADQLYRNITNDTFTGFTPFISTQSNTDPGGYAVLEAGLIDIGSFLGFTNSTSPERFGIRAITIDSTGFLATTNDFITVIYERDTIFSGNVDRISTSFINNSTAFPVIPSGNGVLLSRISPVPVPAAMWLFGSGLIGLSGIAIKKRRAIKNCG